MHITQNQAPIGKLWNTIQSWLFPMLEDEIGELDEKHRLFVAVCELCALHDHVDAYRWCGNGCPPHERLALCKAFIAKAIWDFATTRDLIDAIRMMSARLGHVAIIDDNPGRGEKREFSPAEAVRYRERSSVERVNSHLHDEHGGRHVRVRGSVKVAAHLAFGLVVIAAEQMLRMLT